MKKSALTHSYDSMLQCFVRVYGADSALTEVIVRVLALARARMRACASCVCGVLVICAWVCFV